MFKPPDRVNDKDSLPRHAQVQRILRDMVISGRLKPGDKIPAEVKLADALGVSKMTVNKALLALTANGLFVRQVGRGTFVAPQARDMAQSEQRRESGAGGDRPGGVAVPQQQQRQRITLSFVEGARNVLESPYYSGIYQGVLDAVQRADADAAVELSLATLAARDYVAEEAERPADGRLIIAPRAESIPSIEALWEAGRPLVVVGASWPSMNVPSVDSDNIGGAAEAVRHLLGLGHTRVALLYAEKETANTQDRIVGYRRALSMAGITPEADREVCAEQAWKAGSAATQRLVSLLRDSSEPVTAIFAAGHYLALEALNASREAGRSVPEDVSVVAYDDPLSAQLVYPPLTSVRQPLFEMGQRAAERLMRLMREEIHEAAGRGSAIREILPARLIVRASTAADRTATAQRHKEQNP